MSSRRAELLELAAKMFAERGYGQTTVRDIADAAGILSGSLYHHFDSKESMVDEILRTFLDELFARYREVVDAGRSTRTRPSTSRRSNGSPTSRTAAWSSASCGRCCWRRA
jgi:AcrR family transcriptional regulator